MDRLDQLVLDARGKSGFQRMAPALVTLQGAAELLRGIARRGGILDREKIDAGMLAHQFGHRTARPGRGQLDLRPAIGEVQTAGRRLGDMSDDLLGQAHHVGVVGIGLVELERREFGVMPRRQALIAKAAVDLEHLVGEPADDEPLQMQFRRDAEEELHIERVVVRDEGLGRGAARDRVEHRRFDFEIAARQQKGAHRRDDAAAPAQCLAALRVHDQVEIALAVAQLDIGEPVILLGERPQRFCEQRDFRRVDRQFAAWRAAHEALDADQIANVEQAHERELLGREMILVAEDLDLARGIVQVDEHAAVAHRADAAGDPHALLGLGASRQIGVAGFELGRFGGAGEADRIGVDAERLQCRELFQAHPAKRIVVVPDVPR